MDFRKEKGSDMSHYFENDTNLKSVFRTVSYKYDSFSFEFLSDNGVFSKDRIDYGSRLLLETYLKLDKTSRKVLDVGCGYGFIGCSISKINNSYVDMIDINKRAIHLTNKNIKSMHLDKARVFESDAYQNVNNKYDVIITNPPIRVGKNKVLEILLGAFEHLNEDGVLYFVIRKNQGALSIKKIIEENNKYINILCKEKGYIIFESKNK